jgi:hypothetical protein
MTLDYIYNSVLDHMCMYDVSPFFHLSQRLHQLQHLLGAHVQSLAIFVMVFGYPE